MAASRRRPPARRGRGSTPDAASGATLDPADPAGAAPTIAFMPGMDRWAPGTGPRRRWDGGPDRPAPVPVPVPEAG